MPAKEKPRLEFPPLREGIAGQYDTLRALWEAYLHMACWRTPHYKQLPKEDRDGFLQFLKVGLLFDYVETIKVHTVAAGLRLPDGWLVPLSAGRVTLTKPLPKSDRGELQRLVSVMYPALVRLSASLRFNVRGKVVGPLTKAMTPSRLAKEFGVCLPTFLKRVEEGKIPVEKWGPKLYRVPVSSLPPGSKLKHLEPNRINSQTTIASMPNGQEQV